MPYLDVKIQFHVPVSAEFNVIPIVQCVYNNVIMYVRYNMIGRASI